MNQIPSQVPVHLSAKELVMIDEMYSTATRGRDKCPAQFYKVPVPDPKKTKEAGYPVDKDEIRIRIFIDSQTVHEAPIRTFADNSGTNFHPMNDRDNRFSERHVDSLSDDDRVIYKPQWEAFLKGDAEQIIGYRLEVLWAKTPSKATPYRHFGIYTAEQLRDASDEVVRQIMGGLDDRAFVTKFLASMEAAGPTREAFNEISELREKLAARDEEMAELREMFKQHIANQGGTAVMQASKKVTKPKGRPKKVKTTDIEEVQTI